MPVLQISRNGNSPFVTHCLWAKTSWHRLVGLLNHEKLDESEGLLIEPCKQIHTWFMAFPIDVVFLSHDNTILSTRTMKPWKLSPLVLKAKKVLELPEGACAKWQLSTGEQLKIEAKELSNA